MLLADSTRGHIRRNTEGNWLRLEIEGSFARGGATVLRTNVMTEKYCLGLERITSIDFHNYGRHCSTDLSY